MDDASCSYNRDWIIDVTYTLVPIPAISIRTVSHTRADTTSLPSTLPSLAAFICEVCHNPSHSTLSCSVLPLDALSTLAATCKGNMKKKEDRNWHQHSPRPGPRFSKNRLFHSNGQQLPYSGQNKEFCSRQRMRCIWRIIKNRGIVGRNPW